MSDKGRTQGLLKTKVHHIIPKPKQIKGKTDYGVRPSIIFYFDSEKEYKLALKVYGGKKKEPRTKRLLKFAKNFLRDKNGKLA